MEKDKEPDTENVAYLDEYPEAAERVRLRRLAKPAIDFAYLGSITHIDGNPFYRDPEPPDGAA